MIDPAPISPPARRARLFPLTTGHLVGYSLFVVALIALFWYAIGRYERWLDERQRQLDRYAAERALDALAAGDEDEALSELDLLLAERPIYRSEFFKLPQNNVWEGPVYRNRVTVYQELSARLLDAEFFPEAERVAMKAILEYHTASRVIELLTPWELLHAIHVALGDWMRAWESARILTAHGLRYQKASIRRPNEIEPNPLPVNPRLFDGAKQALPDRTVQLLEEYYDDTSGFAFADSRRIRDYVAAAQETSSPLIRRKMINLLQRALIQSGPAYREEARRLLRSLWGHDPGILDDYWFGVPDHTVDLVQRDPTLMEMFWRDRPGTSTLSVSNFMDSFRTDPRVQVQKFDNVQLLETGYFDPDNKFFPMGDWLHLWQNVGFTLNVVTLGNVRQICIGYEATQALGIHPILLLRIENQAYIPIYLDGINRDEKSEELGRNPANQDIVTLEVNLAPGEYKFEFIFLNDGAFNWRFQRREVNEDRNLLLHRMALVRVPPSDDLPELTSQPPSTLPSVPPTALPEAIN